LAQTRTDGALLFNYPRQFQAIDRKDNISGPKLNRSAQGGVLKTLYTRFSLAENNCQALALSAALLPSFALLYRSGRSFTALGAVPWPVAGAPG
jgi:hypothetical protein